MRKFTAITLALLLMTCTLVSFAGTEATLKDGIYACSSDYDHFFGVDYGSGVIVKNGVAYSMRYTGGTKVSVAVEKEPMPTENGTLKVGGEHGAKFTLSDTAYIVDSNDDGLFEETPENAKYFSDLKSYATWLESTKEYKEYLDAIYKDALKIKNKVNEYSINVVTGYDPEQVKQAKQIEVYKNELYLVSKDLKVDSKYKLDNANTKVSKITKSKDDVVMVITYAFTDKSKKKYTITIQYDIFGWDVVLTGHTGFAKTSKEYKMLEAMMKEDLATCM